jgi:hypothetical protein
MEFKSYNDFKTAIKNCGLAVAEAEYKKSISPPYACYFRSSESSLFADGKPILTMTKMAVELYTDKNDIVSESVIETWFKSQKIYAKKTERAFVESENYYETVYEFELIFNE